jgi:GNAT superfamily N-acetyltransferase
VAVAPLVRSLLAEATRVLGAACAYDRAAEVAEEKLFEDGPGAPAHAFGAWEGGQLVGVASTSSRWIRLIAVVPEARRRGHGSALLAACEAAALATGATKLSALAQPGNYLAPGVDERNVEAIAWLEKRGFARGSELRENVLVNVRDNPRVTPERLAEAVATAREHGYEIRRATIAEREALAAAIAGEFGGAWPFEVARAIGDPSGVHVALKDDAFCAFAAHDGNNRGLGWFGPTGTWPAHRGQGLGEALLLACLVDVAAVHTNCEIAWIGPRAFYDKVAGVVGQRRFVSLIKPLIS